MTDDRDLPLSSSLPETGVDPAEAPAAPLAEAQAEDPSPEPAEPPVAALSERPPEIPEKFWDAEKGEPRFDALLKSYLELERKLGRMVPLPEGEQDEAARHRLLRALGWPESPEEYEVEPPHPWLERDPELEQRLHQAGFTRDQVQLVYELAAERLWPAVAEAVAELEAEREREKLVAHFGGEEAFARIARAVDRWAKSHLEPEVYETLAGSRQGVLALVQMMRASEPELVGEAEGGALAVSEEQLVEMMRDPRYWRDRDPEFVARVTEGFRQLYGT